MKVIKEFLHIMLGITTAASPFIIMVSVLFYFGNSRPYVNPFIVNRPAVIPLTNCSGDTIEWNLAKQRAYDTGRLFVVRDSAGCISYIIRELE